MNNPYTKADLEIIIATMHRNSMDFLLQMFPNFKTLDCSILIINQTVEGAFLESVYSNVKVINVLEKGLSKSRNLGISYAQKKIIVLADDDIVYHKDFADKIIEAHNLFPEIVAIQHPIENPSGLSNKKYPSHTLARLNTLQLLSVISIELSVNLSILKKTGVRFDENFGLGAKFAMGEETLFLMDLHHKKQQIAFVQGVIATHENKTSIDKFDFISRYYVQGAFLTRMPNSDFRYRLFQKLFFDLKQSQLTFKEVPQAYKEALKGRNDFLLKIK